MSTTASPSLYVGVDGGGSSTDFVIASLDGSILASFTGESTNFNSVGTKKAKETIFHGLTSCIAQIPAASLQSIASIVLGMSGCNNGDDSQRIIGWVKEMFTERQMTPPTILCFNDSLIALASGTGGRLHGVVLISGTGMIAYGRNADRAGVQKVDQRTNSIEFRLHGQAATEWIAGGNGGLMDLGCGFSIGLEAMKVAFRLSDGMYESEDEADRQWIGSVLEKANVKEIEDIVGYVYNDLNWGRIASFAPIVINAAERGSKRAASIVQENADYLVRAFAAIHKRVAFQKGEALPVVLSGGVLGSPLMNRLVRSGISAIEPTAHYLDQKVSPAVAAALIGVENAKANK